MEKLKNKRLVSFLMDHKHIETVTVSKSKIIAVVSDKFTPAEVPVLIKAVGQTPRTMTEDNTNYIIFNRY